MKTRRNEQRDLCVTGWVSDYTSPSGTPYQINHYCGLPESQRGREHVHTCPCGAKHQPALQDA